MNTEGGSHGECVVNDLRVILVFEYTYAKVVFQFCLGESLQSESGMQAASIHQQ